MKTTEWREKTIEQLRKDMRMSGVPLEDEEEGARQENPFSFITTAIRVVKGNKPAWDNLNYRIDIPHQVEMESLSDEAIARLYLLRSFQKVWLRHQFSDNATKDTTVKPLKDLKP